MDSKIIKIVADAMTIIGLTAILGGLIHYFPPIGAILLGVVLAYLMLGRENLRDQVATEQATSAQQARELLEVVIRLQVDEGTAAVLAQETWRALFRIPDASTILWKTGDHTKISRLLKMSPWVTHQLLLGRINETPISIPPTWRAVIMHDNSWLEEEQLSPGPDGKAKVTLPRKPDLP